MLEEMTVEQVANFTYWVTEHRTHRNSDKYRGKDRVRFIQQVLIPEFFSKYPNGILTGWTNNQ
jgi:hypothetical protein